MECNARRGHTSTFRSHESAGAADEKVNWMHFCLRMMIPSPVFSDEKKCEFFPRANWFHLTQNWNWRVHLHRIDAKWPKGWGESERCSCARQLKQHTRYNHFVCMSQPWTAAHRIKTWQQNKAISNRLASDKHAHALIFKWETMRSIRADRHPARACVCPDDGLGIGKNEENSNATNETVWCRATKGMFEMEQARHVPIGAMCILNGVRSLQNVCPSRCNSCTE